MARSTASASSKVSGLGKPVMSSSSTTKSPASSFWELKPRTAFFVFLTATLFGAFFSPIQDCDEVFNYWEPSHYLNHGYGLQTWEYSPVYAIRSWAYAGIHSGVIAIGRVIPFPETKSMEFYFLRAVLGIVCALCESRLFVVLSRTLNPRLALIFLVIMVTSTGMFHASTAYLPSSFAMYTAMLGTAAFLDWKGGRHTAQGIMWFGVGATLGWPFAGALVLPFLLEEALAAAITQEVVDTIRRFLDGTVRSLIILALQVAVDVFFYKKLLCVPWNIVAYNVFGGKGKGPDIYGTEPWHFYFRNLFLNFNIWVLLAIFAFPALLVQHFVRQQPATRQSFVRNVMAVSPFYIWLGIFTVQPHKEERFMYPAYPLLALNAAITLHVVLQWLGNSRPAGSASKIPTARKFAFLTAIISTSIAVSVLRTAGMISAYSAPLSIYEPLTLPGVAQPGDTVCLGKEWYRFPSSYFLPNGMRAKFIRSEFRGLLPGEFSEANAGFGLFPGAWLEPPGMNDENKEDPGKYTAIEHCSYLVDSHFPNAHTSNLEPNYIEDTQTWEPVSCSPFLDTSRTSTIGRLLWLPGLPLIPERFRRHWGQYCLLRRRKQV